MFVCFSSHSPYVYSTATSTTIYATMTNDQALEEAKSLGYLTVSALNSERTKQKNCTCKTQCIHGSCHAKNGKLCVQSDPFATPKVVGCGCSTNGCLQELNKSLKKKSKTEDQAAVAVAAEVKDEAE